ncbi:hypothetical protein ACO0SA_001769 [Hanseniaspora valbyensis]
MAQDLSLSTKTPVDISDKVIMEALQSSQNRNSIINKIDQEKYIAKKVRDEYTKIESKTLDEFAEKLSVASKKYFDNKKKETDETNEKRSTNVAALQQQVTSLHKNIEGLIIKQKTQKNDQPLQDLKNEILTCLTKKENIDQPLQCYDLIQQFKKLTSKSI